VSLDGMLNACMKTLMKMASELVIKESVML